MHIHILGICGTFMGGLAALAREAGHRVTGCDAGVYPPMSEQLRALGIELIEGYDAGQLALKPDMFVIGNVVSRARLADGAPKFPLMEAILDAGAPYISGPQWLLENVLQGRHVLAVAGTHGKTTTTSMLAWILERAGLSPGFLVGGVPLNFGISARLGTQAAGQQRSLFVIEADEYDTAFFDKRSKFVHYRPRTAILNNLEYDHADIYPDVASIQRQFHHLVRTVPGNGLIVANGADQRLDEVLAQGCWTPRESFAHEGGVDWSARLLAADGSEFEVMFRGERQGRVRWGMIGGHNVDNALAAIAAARHAGVPVAAAVEALSVFGGIKRRMELRGTVAGVTVYDDFAHHPTAIATTVAGLRHRVGSARIVAVLEPRSNTMKLGVHRDEIAHSLAAADRVWFYRPADLGWDLAPVAGLLGPRASVATDLDGLVAALANESLPGDHVLVMSNGGFGGLHGRLLEALAKREATREDS